MENRKEEWSALQQLHDICKHSELMPKLKQYEDRLKHLLELNDFCEKQEKSLIKKQCALLERSQKEYEERVREQ